MVTLKIRFDDGAVKIRPFGNGNYRRWTLLRPGEIDALSGWSYDELRRLGEGIWSVPTTTMSNQLSDMMN